LLRRRNRRLGKGRALAVALELAAAVALGRDVGRIQLRGRNWGASGALLGYYIPTRPFSRP
jgi:hypothetical protein